MPLTTSVWRPSGVAGTAGTRGTAGTATRDADIRVRAMIAGQQAIMRESLPLTAISSVAISDFTFANYFNVDRTPPPEDDEDNNSFELIIKNA